MARPIRSTWGPLLAKSLVSCAFRLDLSVTALEVPPSDQVLIADFANVAQAHNHQDVYSCYLLAEP